MARWTSAFAILNFGHTRRLVVLSGCITMASCAAAEIEATGSTPTPGTSSQSCELSPGDQAWLDEALRAWELSLATIAETAPPGNAQAIIFDNNCKLSSRTALTGGEKVWTAEPHTGEVLLPDGNKLPVQVASFAAPAPDGSFFVMAAPSIWEAHGVHSVELGLRHLMTAVMLHEAAHVLQFPTYGSRISRLSDARGLPDDLSDDSIQEWFEAEVEFASSIARETELLLAAAAAADRTNALRFAAEARQLARARHDRWFVGDFAYLAEAEDVWLTLEGSGQWLGYRWLMDRNGGGHSSKVAAHAFGIRGGSWSQRHGFAHFLALERLTGPEWRKRAFGDGAKTIGEMLDEALLERESRPCDW